MLYTRVCQVLGIRYPIVQAGMASYAGPELVAAVSNAGGLGLLGGVDRDVDNLERAIDAVRERTDRPFGVNLVLAEPHLHKLDLLIAARVPVIATSWGDAAHACERAHAAGLRVLHQVNGEQEAARAVRAGVDVVAAQGSDGGGHIGRIGTLALVPAVVDAADGTPVIAAGGIADGRGLAAALALGAEGAMLGTRFLATQEAPVARAWKEALLAAGTVDAWQSPVPDVVWEVAWPGADSRVLANDVIRRWHGREAEIPSQREQIAALIDAAKEAGNVREMVAYAGQSVGAIHDILPAGEVVERIAREAAAVLRERATLVEREPVAERGGSASA
jgi:NAD(P)H-dependent flavin oxidoreductase YrpB (nitropropane dioxygenase family)